MGKTRKQITTFGILSNTNKLNAIVWKARKMGISYGALSSSLSGSGKEQIYEEYEAYMTEERKKHTFLSKSKKA